MAIFFNKVQRVNPRNPKGDRKWYPVINRKRCTKPSTRPPSNPLKASPRRRSKIGERNSLLADEHENLKGAKTGCNI